MRAICILAFVLLFSGCAYDHGIIRTASASSIPTPEEIKNALGEIPGVKKVTHFSHDGRAPIDRLLGTNEGWIEEFAVHGEEFGFSLRFGTLKTKKTVSMQMMTRESKPASFRVADVREFMIMVYHGLRVRFPELPSEESFIESTSGLELETSK